MSKKVESALKLLETEIQTNHVKHLMGNPGHANGYNEVVYLKNDAWNRKRYKAAVRALLTIKTVLSF